MHDEEGLYRSVQNDPRLFTKVGDVWRVSQAAFSDRNQQPSVDRAWLKDHEPRNSQFRSTDGIVCLETRDVRNIKDVSPREVDVMPAPVEDHETLPDNPAHALVVTNKALGGSQFKKLKKALARRSVFMIPPSESG